MTKKVDKSAPLPRYYQVYQSLLERIREGEFSEEQPLPPERMLTQEYGVSRITIIKAMELLKNEGVIDRQHGRGTFIRTTKLENDPTEQLSLTDNLARMGIKPEWRVLKKDWHELDEEKAQLLSLPADETYFQVTVQLLTDSSPFGYHKMQISADLARQEKVELLTDNQLVQFFRDYPINNRCKVERGFEALPAGPAEVKLLEVNLRDPVLLIDLIYKDQNDRVVEFIRSYFRGDTFRYTL